MISEGQTGVDASARQASESGGTDTSRRSWREMCARSLSRRGEQPSRLLVVVAFAAVYLIWGSTYLAIRFAIQTLPPFLMAGSRFVIAGTALVLWARAKGVARPTRAELRSACVVGALLFLGGNGGVVWSEQYVASGVAALFVATEPLWIVLLGWARRGGSRPTARVSAGLLLGFAGVWLLVASGVSAGGAGGRGLIATVALLAASVSWAVGSLYSAHAPLPPSSLLSAGIQMLAGGVLMLATGTLAGEWKSFDPAAVSAVSVGAMLYLIVCGALVAFTAYSWLLRRVAPARAATYAYVNPLVAVFLGWALAGEQLTARTLLAASVITASVVIIVTRRPAGKRLATQTQVGEE
jgi:drug/metabolite transporter (DMT)-like permease